MKKIIILLIMLFSNSIYSQVLTNGTTDIEFQWSTATVSYSKPDLIVVKQDNIVRVSVDNVVVHRIDYRFVTSPVMVSAQALYDTLTTWINQYSSGGGSGTSGWSLTGNSGTNAGTNFIGTLDNSSFNIKTRNTQSGRIDQNGNSFYGVNSGSLYTQDTGHVDTVIIDNGGSGYIFMATTVEIDPPTSGTTATCTPIISVAQNEIQNIQATCDAGTFTLTWNGTTTGAMNWNVSLPLFQSELNITFGPARITASGGGMNTGFTVEFIGVLGNSPQPLFIGNSSLTSSGKAQSIYVTQTQAGIVGGVITGVTITNHGSGYTSAPTVTITGGNSDASAHCDMSIPTGTSNTGVGINTLLNNYTGSNNVAIGTNALGNAVNLSGRGALTCYGGKSLQEDTTIVPIYWYEDPSGAYSNNRIYANGEFYVTCDPVKRYLFLKYDGLSIAWGDGITAYTSMQFNPAYIQTSWQTENVISYLTLDDIGFTFEITPAFGTTATFNIDTLGGITQHQFSGSLTDGAPTSSEIESVLGLAGSHGAGYKCTILDTDGSGNLYMIEGDGSLYWYYIEMNKAN